MVNMGNKKEFLKNLTKAMGRNRLCTIRYRKSIILDLSIVPLQQTKSEIKWIKKHESTIEFDTEFWNTSIPKECYFENKYEIDGMNLILSFK